MYKCHYICLHFPISGYIHDALKNKKQKPQKMSNTFRVFLTCKQQQPLSTLQCQYDITSFICTLLLLGQTNSIMAGPIAVGTAPTTNCFIPAQNQKACNTSCPVLFVDAEFAVATAVAMAAVVAANYADFVTAGKAVEMVAMWKIVVSVAVVATVTHQYSHQRVDYLIIVSSLTLG